MLFTGEKVEIGFAGKEVEEKEKEREREREKKRDFLAISVCVCACVCLQMTIAIAVRGKGQRGMWICITRYVVRYLAYKIHTLRSLTVNY